MSPEPFDLLVFLSAGAFALWVIGITVVDVVRYRRRVRQHDEQYDTADFNSERGIR